MILRAAWLAVAVALALAGCRASAPEAPVPSPAIWQVTAPDGSGHGWLFGTIHALPDGYAWQTPQVSAALQQAGVLVVEVAELGDAAAGQRAFAQVSQSGGLPPLLSRVAPEHRKGLQEALDRADMAERDFARTESWAAALLIANGARSGDTDNGVDRALLTSGKPVIGLESHGVQFALFDRLAEDDQRVLLAELAREAADPQGERALAEAWVTGDMDRIAQEDGTGILADPELRAALLVDRNRAWLLRLISLIDGGRRPFVAVGAQHMAGPDGLPAMLAARGYRVERIR
jgi:uncharacterized protein YbaP (TraB family)